MTTQPTLLSLESLEAVLASTPLDPARFAAALGGVEAALGEHRREVNAPGGALDEDDLVARPGLRRRAERLRREVVDLLLQASALHERADSAGPQDEAALRRRAGSLLEGVRRLRDGEAGLALESVGTDLGAGD